MDKDEFIIHSDGAGMAYVQLSATEGAAIVPMESKTFLGNNTRTMTKHIPIDGYRGYVPWGDLDDVPQQVITKVGKSPDLSTNLLFNITAGYGNGIMAVRKSVGTDNKLVYVPVVDYKDSNDFFLYNDIDGYINNQLTDLNYFYNTFAEIILSKDRTKIVSLTHKEAAFSRWETMNPDTGKIENHFYSGKFYSQEPLSPNDVVVTPVLDFKNPVMDILKRIGRIPDPLTGKINITPYKKEFRYIIAMNFPSAGRFYYQEPPWYSLFKSGWYDFAMLIPAYKQALLNNGMTIKYMVLVNEKYFPAIFHEEAITTPEAQKKRVALEYANIKAFLSGTPNAGKATFGKVKYTPDGKKEPMIEIIPIENNFKGGEYIEDSEEVSNILAYGTGVHSSLVGSHGKAKSINGTEARELFIIKQSMMKPYRDVLLKPLNVVKAVNGWDSTIDFVIPNMELTTLDKNPNGNVNTVAGTVV